MVLVQAKALQPLQERVVLIHGAVTPSPFTGGLGTGQGGREGGGADVIHRVELGVGVEHWLGVRQASWGGGSGVGGRGRGERERRREGAGQERRH